MIGDVPKQYSPSAGTSVKLAFIKAGSFSPTQINHYPQPQALIPVV
jgi:hypothetical protein